MASVNVAKYTIGEARALCVHFDDEKRQTLKHENPHIDAEKTPENEWIGTKSYNEVLEALKQRLDEVDNEHPPGRVKADRKTVINIDVPIPEWITEQGREAEIDFLHKAYEELANFYGKDNIVGATAHFDERHNYIEPKTKIERTSLNHMHVFGLPYAYWQDKKGVEHEGINAKNCLTKSSLREVNARINDMCLREYSREYQTHETPGQLSVEDLKVKSMKAEKELLTEQTADLERGIIKRQRVLDKVTDELENKEFEFDNLRQNYNDTALEYSRLNDEIKRLQAKIDKLKYREAEKIDLENRINEIRKQQMACSMNLRDIENEVRSLETKRSSLIDDIDKIEHKKSAELEKVDKVDILRADLNELAKKKVWSSQDKEAILMFARRGEAAVCMKDELEELKKDNKSLKNQLKGVQDKLKTALNDVEREKGTRLSLERDNSSLKAKTSRLEAILKEHNIDYEKILQKMNSLKHHFTR